MWGTVSQKTGCFWQLSKKNFVEKSLRWKAISSPNPANNPVPKTYTNFVHIHIQFHIKTNLKLITHHRVTRVQTVLNPLKNCDINDWTKSMSSSPDSSSWLPKVSSVVLEVTVEGEVVTLNSSTSPPKSTDSVAICFWVDGGEFLLEVVTKSTSAFWMRSGSWMGSLIWWANGSSSKLNVVTWGMIWKL